MNKKPNHNADIKNANIGEIGTNKTYDKRQGNQTSLFKFIPNF